MSPLMQNTALREKNLNYVYLAFNVLPEKLKYVIDGFKSVRCVGFNITIPHKVNIINYLDEIDEDAKLIGAVNTVKINNNVAIGYNTDGIGAEKSLEEYIGPVKNKNILIIGAGGASRAISFQLSKNNDITIINRTVEKAQFLAEEIYNKIGKSVKFGGLNINTEGYDIVINTTSLGMYPNVNTIPPIDLSNINEDTVVMDIVYNPLETKFLKECKKRGAKVINGIGMLVYQGAESFKIWTSVEPNVDLMKKVIINELKNREKVF